MQLSSFVELAANASAEEWPGLARVCSIYWDNRLRGARGLRQEDVDDGDVEILIEHFRYEPAVGYYIHPGIDDLLNAQPGMKGATEEAFESFWSIYPRKVGKAAARKVWLRKVKTHSLATKVIKALRDQILAYDWANAASTQFIPHATTWLNQERWDDVLEVEPASAPMEGVV